MMRLSIMPLVLSLFIAFSVFGKPIDSEFDNAIVNAEPLVFKAVTKKASTKSPKLIVTKSGIAKKNSKARTAMKSSNAIVHSEMEGNQTVEEKFLQK